MSFIKAPGIDWAKEAPTAIIEPEVVTKKLQDLAGSVPLRTHKIKKIRVDNVTPDYPAWQHGMRAMVEYENPFLYLKKFMNYHKEFDRR